MLIAILLVDGVVYTEQRFVVPHLPRWDNVGSVQEQEGVAERRSKYTSSRDTTSPYLKRTRQLNCNDLPLVNALPAPCAMHFSNHTRRLYSRLRFSDARITFR
jgi:hypothetical protein